MSATPSKIQPIVFDDIDTFGYYGINAKAIEVRPMSSLQCSPRLCLSRKSGLKAEACQAAKHPLGSLMDIGT